MTIPIRLVIEGQAVFEQAGLTESVARAEKEIVRRDALIELLDSRGVYSTLELRRILLNSGR